MVILKLTEFISFPKRYNSVKIELDWPVNILDRYIKDFMQDQQGATAIEYGLIAALVSVVIIGALSSLGLNADGLYTATFGLIGDNISQANN